MEWDADFMIERDVWDQRFAYPVSNLARVWFDEHAPEFDVSDQGIELDTTPVALQMFVGAVRGMRVVWVFHA